MKPRVSQVAAAVAAILFGWPILRFVLSARLEGRHAAAARAGQGFPSAQLANLDRVLQARFAVVPGNDFGMSRIGPRHELFKPVSSPERTAIEGLRRSGLQVVFFVAGRSYLKGLPSAGMAEAYLQGPVYITDKPPLTVIAGLTGHHYEQPIFRTSRQPADLPSPSQLVAPLRGMLRSSDPWDHSATPDRKTFVRGSWSVLAAPIRASNQRCVDCHERLTRQDPPRFGEPLGIALYVYRPAPIHNFVAQTFDPRDPRHFQPHLAPGAVAPLSHY